MEFKYQTQLFEMLHRAIEWPLIEAGLSEGVFDMLVTPCAAEQVANEVNWQPEQTEIFLDALASLNLVRKHKLVYELSGDFADFLTSESPRSMRDTLLHLSSIKMTTPDQLLSVLRGDEQARKNTDFESAHFWQKATQNLRSFHRSFASDYCASLLQSQPFWSRVNRVLEIGAGSDVLAQKLISENPDLDYHIFDLPQVIEQLSPQFDGNGQITFHSGNYNHDSLPMRFDLLFASMSLYYANDLPTLIAQAYSAINAGGCFVSFHEGLTQERTQPRHHVIGRFLPAIQGNDVSFSQGDIAQIMMDAGFKQVRSQSITTPFGPMELDIAFK